MSDALAALDTVVNKLLDGLRLPPELEYSCAIANLDSHVRAYLCNITLRGEVIRKAIAGLDPNEEDWTVKWLLPKDNIFVDLVNGGEWISHYRLFYSNAAEEIDEQPGKLRLNQAPDLSRFLCRPSWLGFAWREWKDFSSRLDKPKFGYQTLINLEMRLNSPWVRGAVRSRQRMSRLDVNNPLRALEQRRQVGIHFRANVHGRLRLPHTSHKHALCPFHTPESKHIGLELHLAAGVEEISGDTLRAPAKNNLDWFLFSVAAGMAPYPTHTDGPRLMMAGKNLKQAECGIQGGEPALVPGEYERLSRGQRLIKVIPDNYDDDYRFCREIDGNKKEYLGLNAFVALMPWGGYTYDDGLVVSQSLAKRLAIPHSTLQVSRRYSNLLIPAEQLKLLTKDCVTKTVDDILRREIEQQFNALSHTELFCYQDSLPFPQPLLKELGISKTRVLGGKWVKEDGALSPACYEWRIPGKLRAIAVSVRTGGERQIENKKHTILEISFRYEFDIALPLGLGDKLTGRHGNKGVVAQILPEDKMPLISVNGKWEPAELLISPCSVLGRKNFGQLYEMLHSLLLTYGHDKGLPPGMKLAGLQEEPFEYSQMDAVLEFCKKLGADEAGAFEVDLRDGRKGKAFAGFQYIARLHHHAWKKLQARGDVGPMQAHLGQPSSGGARTGQRFGEMENWSLLSHNSPDKEGLAKELLLAMRKRSCPEYNATRVCFANCLAWLGVKLKASDVEGESGSARTLHFSPGEDNSPDALVGVVKETQKGDLYATLLRLGWLGDEDNETSLRDCLNKNIEELEQELIKIQSTAEDKKTKERKSKAIKSEIKRGESVQNLLTPSGFLPINRALYDFIDAELANGETDWKRCLDKIKSSFDQSHSELFHYLSTYQEMLFAFLLGNQTSLELKYGKWILQPRDEISKKGILRRHMLSRRFNHSGRAVIVPCPDLPPDQVRLPVAMLVEMLAGDNENLARLELSELERKKIMRLANMPAPGQEAQSMTRDLDAKLQSRPLWVLLLRQPCLHRHNVQAFRVRCWAEPVIGIPPLVTPGYNADFDGDTMAVFLPPHPFSGDLEQLSILKNPGLVGAGKTAFADEMDLALGWLQLVQDEPAQKKWRQALDIENIEKMRLADIYAEILGKHAQDLKTCASMFLELQQDVCAASSGAATLTPQSLQDLSKRFAEKLPLFKEVRERLLDVIGESPAESSEGGSDDKAWRNPKQEAELRLGVLTRCEKLLMEEVASRTSAQSDESAVHFGKLAGHIRESLVNERAFYEAEYAHTQHNKSAAEAVGYLAEFEKLAPAIRRVKLEDELWACYKDIIKKSLGETVEFFLETEGQGGLSGEPLNRIVLKAKAKGSVEALAECAGLLGEIEQFKSCEQDEPRRRAYVDANFWSGLDMEQLFVYSYACRDAMASKKLLVAEAGYLSRLLAEGLYELCVKEEDCGSRDGLLLLPEEGQLRISFGGRDMSIPCEKDMADPLKRIVWGRVPVDASTCLTMRDVQNIAKYWSSGGQGQRPQALDDQNRLLIRSPLACRCWSESGALCRRCYGADPAAKLFDRPTPVPIGSNVGLTAAQAIGERGTQLAMKRFHDVSGARGNAVESLKQLLIYATYCDLWKKTAKPQSYEGDQGLRFEHLIQTILYPKTREGKQAPFKELPQQLIHFEVALRPDNGLWHSAEESNGRCLSSLAFSKLKQGLLELRENGNEDHLDTLKSQLIWEGGA